MGLIGLIIMVWSNWGLNGSNLLLVGLKGQNWIKLGKLAVIWPFEPFYFNFEKMAHKEKAFPSSLLYVHALMLLCYSCCFPPLGLKETRRA